MRVTKSIIVTQTGVGKPDYTREVSAGRERAGISLKYNQQLAIVGVIYTDQVVPPIEIPWVQAPLAAGATGHLYAQSTGLPLPFIMPPAGYTASLVQYEWALGGDTEIWIYWEGYLVACPAIVPSGSNHGWNMVVPFNSEMIDPTGASPHTMDIQVVNIGGGDLEGSIDFIFILEAVGTAWPTTKDCRCPFCHHIQTVPIHTTKIVCGKCGRAYIVYDFSRIREL